MNLQERKKLFLEWIKSDKLNIYLLLIISLAVILRIWIFFKTLNQPIWWDEGDYMYTAKKLGLSLETRDLWYYRRTFFLPLLFSLMFKITSVYGEILSRFIILLFSIGLVISVYLLAKEMFDKKTALFAAFGISVSRISLFLTGRLLNEIASAFLLTLSFYFLWKSYIKNEKPKLIYLFGLFFGLALLTRFAVLLMVLPLLILLFTNENFKILKNKKLWLSFSIILIILSPFFYLYQGHYPGGISDFVKHYAQGTAEGKSIPDYYLGWKGPPQYFMNILSNSSLPVFIFFLIGLFLILDFILGLDLIFKKEGTNLRRNLFLIIWILMPVIYHGLYSEYLEERYLMMAYPAIFAVFGYGITKILSYIPEKNKLIKIFIVLVVVVIASYTQVKGGKEIIDFKLTSFDQIKETGVWLKTVSNPKDIIISQSRPQHGYYAERSIYSPTQFTSEEDFISNLSILKPRFYVISAYQEHPQWALSFPQKYNLSLKGAWYQDPPQNTKVGVVIYEFNQSSFN